MINHDKILILLKKCKFEVGSYTYDTSYLIFETILNYDPTGEKKTVLDYSLQVTNLKEEDSQWHWEGTNKNYSLGGFEMNFERHTSKYMVEYYFPSVLFVATSWVIISEITSSICIYHYKRANSNNKVEFSNCHPFSHSG